MTDEKLIQISNELYPDERRPGWHNEYMQNPDIIISHEDERSAFIFGFQMGFNHGVEHQKNARKKDITFR